MELRKLGRTGLDIAPLVLGGNVFGWTAPREATFAVLDAYLEAGGNVIDTADVYNRYAPGLVGGESETLIGEWMETRGCRDRVVLISKGGLPMSDELKGLSPDYLPRACEASLRRLRTDRIDVYLAHRPDPTVPIGETLAAFEALKAAGKIGHAGCSNYSPEELAAALAAGPTYEVFQPEYNLVARGSYEGALEDLCTAHGLGVVTYYALAAGFLSGKYRTAADFKGGGRDGVVGKLLKERGLAVLAALDRVGARHDASPAQVALAWIMARASVAAPIASATSVNQLHEIMAATRLRLTAEDLADLSG